jgi:predicted alpha/beta-hydrolase family hydrolase
MKRLIDGPERADTLAVLAHGAGAGMDSDFMDVFASGLAERGVRVLRFDFPYMEQKKKYPDRQPVLEDAYREAIESARELGFSKLVVGGKSLGGRIASHVVAAGESVDGLVFLGYPLHPPGRPDRIRDAHLRLVEAPMLFVEGTRDPFCPLDTLERVRAALPARTEVFVVDDGDHSLKVRKSSGRSTPEAWAEAIEAVADWTVKL